MIPPYLWETFLDVGGARLRVVTVQPLQNFLLIGK